MPVYDKTLTKDGQPRTNAKKVVDGKKYYFEVFWVNPNGKRASKKQGYWRTKKEAENAERRFLDSIRTVEDEMLTFGQLEEIYLLKRKNELRENVYEHEKTLLSHMTTPLANVKVPRLTTSQYQKVLYELAHKTRNGKQFSTKYKNRIINTFKALCRFGERRFNLVTTVPDRFDSFKVKDSEKMGEMKFITHDQFKQFIETVDDPSYKTLFTVLFYMGLRIGEANALRWYDISFENNTLSVSKTLTTKRRRDDGSYIENPPKTSTSNRVLPMPQIVSKRLSELHDLFIGDKTYSSEWFMFGGRVPLSDSTITLRKNAYFEKAGIPPIRLHDFRHSCASYLINNLGSDNIILISRYLGHKDIAMTLNRYSHLYRSKLIDLVESIDKLESKPEG